MPPARSVTLYTDGSSSLKDKAGGWAFVSQGLRTNEEHYGCRRGDVVTNNLMELLAVLNAYRFCLNIDRDARIISDSQYVVNCANEWIGKWKRNGWTTSVGEPVKNKGLLLQLDEMIQIHRDDGRSVSLLWVKGHAGIPGNERADKLAGYARARQARGMRLVK